MNKALNSIWEFTRLLGNGIKRFYTNTFFTVIIFGITAYLINGNNISKDVTDVLFRIILVSILGFFITTIFTLITEKLEINNKLFKVINILTSLVVPVLHFFFILTDINNKYQITTLAGIIIAMLFISIYFANKSNNENFSIHISYIVKNLFIAGIVTTIIMIGLLICTAAVHFLIYNLDNLSEIYITIASFCWIVFSINIFYAMLPKTAESYKTPKFFKVITLYTALPIYIGLIIILYIYLSKIIATLNFPSGQLNWFASIASLVGISLFLALNQYYNNNALVKWFIKMIGFILLPIIAMQCVAFYIRYINYGLTTLRYISVILIGISIITAILTVIKGGKYVPYVLFLLAFCSIITTTGLFNLYAVPVYEQESRLVRVLKENNMIDQNNKITAKSDIDTESKMIITSAFDYINKEDYMTKSKIFDKYNLQSQFFLETFGFEKEYDDNYNRDIQPENLTTNVNYSLEAQEVNINGYNSLFIINYYNKQNTSNINNENIITVKINEEEFVFDLNNYIKELYKTNRDLNTLSQDKLTIEQGNSKLLIKNIGFTVNQDNDKIIINNVDGYILEK